VALLLHFNWTRVGTIYQNEPRYALVKLILMQRSRKYSSIIKPNEKRKKKRIHKI